MLPFPIINQYGNVVIRSTIKKLDSSTSTMALLYTNGNLYMKGSNALLPFGITHADDFINFTLVLQNVDNVWCGTNHTIVLLKNGEYWCAGYPRSLGLTGQNKVWEKYQKLHDMLNSTGSTVRQICTGLQGTHVVLENNNMYCIGFNNTNCLGVPSLGSTITTFTLTYGGVKKVSYNMNATMIVTTADQVRVIGSSDNYKLGSGNGTLSIWTVPSMPSGYTYAYDVYEGYRHTLIYAATDSTGSSKRLLFSGYNGYNAAGQSPWTATSTAQTYIVGADINFSNFGKGYISMNYQGFYTDGLNVYSSGPAGANIGSSTNNSSGFKPIQFSTAHTGSIDYFCVLGQTSTDSSTFVVTNNLLYACGAAKWLGSDSYNFVLQSVPE